MTALDYSAYRLGETGGDLVLHPDEPIDGDIAWPSNQAAYSA